MLFMRMKFSRKKKIKKFKIAPDNLIHYTTEHPCPSVISIKLISLMVHIFYNLFHIICLQDEKHGRNYLASDSLNLVRDFQQTICS